MLKASIAEMSTWIHKYISSQDGLEYINSDVRVHCVFYTVCQTLFYVVAFRHCDLVHTKKSKCCCCYSCLLFPALRFLFIFSSLVVLNLLSSRHFSVYSSVISFRKNLNMWCFTVYTIHSSIENYGLCRIVSDK
jgi:hypothetical protein